MLGKDPDLWIRSRKLVTKCSKVVEGGSSEAETVGAPSKPKKDLVKSFTRQRGSLGSGFSILVSAG